MKEKLKYLFKNSSYLLIGNFSSKILTFLLVPLYTAVLSTEEYGTYDLIHTTILLCIPVLCLNITDAIMRFSIDQSKELQAEVYSIAVKYILIAGSLFSVGSILINWLVSIEILNDYLFFINVLFWASLINQNFVQVLRGLDDVKGISISGVFGTIITVTMNILFLLVCKWGLDGFFYASIISVIAQDLFLFFRGDIYRYCRFALRISETEKVMLKYCVPLIFTSLSWYINNFSDRYTVTLFEGLSANGIYSVSYKIPAILTAFQTIFIQSWQLSAVKEFHSKEGKAFVRQIHNSCQGLMIVFSSIVILFTRIFARILFSADFYEAWRCVPTLIFYVLFNTLSGIIGGVYIAVKDSSVLAKTAIIGAGINIVLNFVFIYLWGIEGAALATAASSLVIWWQRYQASKKYISLELNELNMFIQFLILGVQAACMTIFTSIGSYLIQIICLVALVLCNIKYMPKLKGRRKT